MNDQSKSQREPMAGGATPHDAVGLVAELARFLKRFWWIPFVTVPVLLLVTVVHEAAHASLVLVQGGIVEEFSWWPSGALWGFVRYTFPASAEYSATAISLAPYGLWLLVSVGVVAYSHRHARLNRDRGASSWRTYGGGLIYVWGFVLPLGDIANAAFPYLLEGKSNDWASAFGPPSMTPALLAAGVGVYALWAGFGTQRRLLADAALSSRAYGAVAVAGLVALVSPLGSLVKGLF